MVFTQYLREIYYINFLFYHQISWRAVPPVLTNVYTPTTVSICIVVVKLIVTRIIWTFMEAKRRPLPLTFFFFFCNSHPFILPPHLVYMLPPFSVTAYKNYHPKFNNTI